MKVVFALRNDAHAKPGGDTQKVKKYMVELQKRGIESEVVTSVGALRLAEADIIHLINLDLPLENIRYANIARVRGIPLALSTIHHPLSGQRAFYAWGEDSFSQITRRIGLPVERSACLRENIRLARMNPRSAITQSGMTWLANAVTKQAELLDRVDLVLPMSPEEANGIRSDVGISAGFVREIPNGFTFTAAKPLPVAYRTGLLSVGRIEPRKNQVALIRALSPLGYDLTFVGSLNRKHASFCRTFLRLVSGNPNIHYRPRMPQEQLSALYDRCRVHVSASWMEVVSQVDLEAAARGAAVIASNNNYAAAYFDGGYQLIDPAKIAHHADEIRGIVTDSYDNPRRPSINQSYNLSWAQVTDRLQCAYEAVL